MPKQGQDTNQVDPNDPYQKVRQTVVNQAGSDPTVTPPPSTPSTPSPTFTTQPVPGGTTPQPASPTFTTQPVDTARGPGVPTTPSSPAGTITGTNPSGYPIVSWQPGQGPTIPAGGGLVKDIPGLPTGANPTGGGGGSAIAQPSPFSKTSTSADLLKQLNTAGAAPGSAQAAAITKQYTDALGITGNPLQAGFTVGQYDPTRSKIYLPGTDLKYDNGQWGAHDFGSADPSQASGSLGLNSTATSSPYADQVRQMLMDRMKTLGQPLDVNDPTIAEPFNAARLASSRQLEQGKKDTAERLYASGDLNTNAAQQADTQSNERAATGLAGVKANLIANQLQQRATQLQQLYSLAVASGDSESARQVQLELASIQAELAREGFGVSLANITANQNADVTKSLI